MKKYYGYFVYNEEEYVIRFKIDGSLKFDRKSKCFIDDQYYLRSIADVIATAAFDNNHSIHIKQLGFSMLLKHDAFVRERARGVKRWKPLREIIVWR